MSDVDPGPYASPQQPSKPDPGMPQYGSPQPGNTLAVVSLVLGICSVTIGCCCWLNVPLGIAAAITGFLGMQKAKNEGASGKGMAIAGLIMGIAALVLVTILNILAIAMNFATFDFQQFQ